MPRPPHLVVVELRLRVPSPEQHPDLVVAALQDALPARYVVVESKGYLVLDDGRPPSRASTSQQDSGALPTVKKRL